MHLNMTSRIFSLFFLVFVVCGNEIKTPLTFSDTTTLVHEQFSKVNVHLNPEILALVENLKTSIFQKPIQYPIDSNNSCVKSIIQFTEDLVSMDEPYAWIMLDSWFKPESGILEGNLLWEGRYYECVNANGSSFKGKYCGAAIPLSSSEKHFGAQAPVLLTIAGCFPDTCSASDLSAFLSNYIPPGVLLGLSCPSVAFTQWEAKEIIALVVVSVLGILVMMSTLYDLRVQCLSTSSYWIEGSSPLEERNGRFQSILVSFSVIQNTKRLLSTRRRSTDIACLHGMRFFSMSWVILGHTFLFYIAYIDNTKSMARYVVEHYEFQVLLSAFYSVDTFFFLSGLLVTYLGLRELRKRDGKMNVPLMYLYRFLRLTPPYAFVLLMSISLWPKFGKGPFWKVATQPLINSCEKYWYTNLLYFNNLYPASIGDECFSWGWYLANDTQFYLLAPLFLWLLYRSWKWGIALLSFFLVSSMTITGAFSAYCKKQPTSLPYGLYANIVSFEQLQYIFWTSLVGSGYRLVAASLPFRFPNQTNTNLTSQSLHHLLDDDEQPSMYMSDLYTKPWCRIGAYLVGMITGYILHAYNNKVRLQKAVKWIGWCLSYFISFELVFGLYPTYSTGSSLSVAVAAFYNAVCRPAWCLSLAWVTIACVSGYGGPVDKLLSSEVFIPLSRLTYTSYLVHPLVIWLLTGTTEVQYHFDISNVVMLFLSTLIITTMFAYIVAMMVEFPVIELMKIMQNRSGAQASFVPHESLIAATDDASPIVPDS